MECPDLQRKLVFAIPHPCRGTSQFTKHFLLGMGKKSPGLDRKLIFANPHWVGEVKGQFTNFCWELHWTSRYAQKTHFCQPQLEVGVNLLKNRFLFFRNWMLSSHLHRKFIWGWGGNSLICQNYKYRGTNLECHHKSTNKCPKTCRVHVQIDAIIK